MADKSTETWINFAVADLPAELQALHKAMLDAKAKFEGAFPCAENKTLRFSYKGQHFDRMGMCEIDKPKSRDEVKSNLATWLQAQRDANRKH